MPDLSGLETQATVAATSSLNLSLAVPAGAQRVAAVALLKSIIELAFNAGLAAGNCPLPERATPEVIYRMQQDLAADGFRIKQIIVSLI